MPRIRQLHASDAPALSRLLTANRAFLQPWEPVRPEQYFTEDGQQQVIEEALSRQQHGLQLCQVILDDAGAVVGRITVSNIVRGAFQSANLGYWISEHVGGRGWATQAVGEIVAVAFDTLRLHRVEAGTIPSNLRSQAVLRKNGFAQFGYAPEYLQIAGRYTDHLLFQKLADTATS